MNDSGVKIEVHLIQNFAPSNLNRDDTGQPKSAYFWWLSPGPHFQPMQQAKHARNVARNQFRSAGVRTKLLKTELAPRLAAKGRTDEKIGIALNVFLTQFYSKMDGDKTAGLLSSVGRNSTKRHCHQQQLGCAQWREGTREGTGKVTSQAKSREP